ncbi:hypothetical protein GN244_ATG15285 [Phytophthora infestans]|uniref:Uncharacterized protein n=1 Tax=Phytophthora infestans TaxID=4787 RepID=A0A833W7P7_PHYIN|nr:hypothetical protein GN244_ATG15285 [Phytophthora infestans]
MASQSSDSNRMVHFGTWEQRAPTSPNQPGLSTQAGVESVQKRIHRAADGTGRGRSVDRSRPRARSLSTSRTGAQSALATTTGAGATSVTAATEPRLQPTPGNRGYLGYYDPYGACADKQWLASGVLRCCPERPSMRCSATVRQPSGYATPVPTSSMPPWDWAGAPVTLAADSRTVTPTPVRTRTATPSYPDFTIGDAMIPAGHGFNGVLTYPSNATTMTGAGTVDAPANVPSSVNQVTPGQWFWYPTSGTQPAVVGTFWPRVWNCAVVSAPYIGWGGWYSRRCYSEWWSSCRCGKDDRRIGTKCWICSAY